MKDRYVVLITGVYVLIIALIASVMLMGGADMMEYMTNQDSGDYYRAPWAAHMQRNA